MNEMNLMEAISQRPEEKIAADLLNAAQPDSRTAAQDNTGFVAADKSDAAGRRPFRIAHHIMFATSVAAGIALIGGFAFLLKTLGNKPGTVMPAGSGSGIATEDSGEYATRAVSTGVITVETTTETTALTAHSAEAKEISFPAKIDGKNVSIWAMTDENTVLVALTDGTPTTEYGLISVKNEQAGDYQKLLDLTDKQNVIAADSRHLVIAEREFSQDYFVVTDCDYRLFDIETKTLGAPFWSQTKRDGQPVGGGSSTAPVLGGDFVYFDDYSISTENGEIISTVYAYDIQSGQVTASYENCYQPIMYRGKLLASRLDKTAGTQQMFSVEDDGASFAITYDGGVLYTRAGSDGIYALTQNTVKDLTTGQTVVGSLNGAEQLSVGESFIVWSRITADYATKPAVYDLKSQTPISLGASLGLPEDAEFNTYTSGNTALMWVNNADRSVNRFLLFKAE